MPKKSSFRGCRRTVLGAAALGVLCLTLSSGALAARLTTAPAPSAPISVTLGRTAITLHSYISHGKALFPRGALVDFILKNNTTERISVRLKLVGKVHFNGSSAIATYTPAGQPIRAGKLRHFKIDFFFRSSFALQELVNGKVVASVPIIVF